LNYFRRYSGFNWTRAILACWPSTADDYEALAPLRADAALLTQGVSYYNALRGEHRVVKVVFVMLISDLVQMYANCRCGSNGGNLGCPNCLTTRADRLAPIDFRNHALVRSDQLIDMLIGQIRGLPGLTAYHQKGLLRRYGILTRRPSPYEGCGLNTCAQSYRDFWHLFMHGIMKGMIQFYMQEMTVADRQTFQARVGAFELPTHVPNVVRGWKPNKHIGNSISMKMYWQLSMVALFAAEGLVTDELYSFFGPHVGFGCQVARRTHVGFRTGVP
jgi:hypothetical protein